MEISYEQVFQFLNTATYPSNCMQQSEKSNQKEGQEVFTEIR